MDSVDIEVLRTAEAWRAGGHRVTLGTIVKTWGSAPRPVGALLVIRDDGQVVGSVSGGCVEDDLIEKVRARKPWRRQARSSLTYGVTDEEATRFGLPCGGTLQLVLEPRRRGERPRRSCSSDLERHELVARRLDMETGARDARARPVAGRARVRRQDARDRARAALAPAADRRRAAHALPRADGAGARLPRHRDATRARNTPSGWDVAGVDARARHARRRRSRR